jgi:hypothetical protein
MLKIMVKWALILGVKDVERKEDVKQENKKGQSD